MKSSGEAYLITITVSPACTAHQSHRLHVLGMVEAGSPDEAVDRWRTTVALPAICNGMQLQGVPLRLRPTEADHRGWVLVAPGVWAYDSRLIEAKVRSWLGKWPEVLDH